MSSQSQMQTGGNIPHPKRVNSISQLLVLNPHLDPPDELEVAWSEQYKNIENLLSQLSETEAINKLQQQVSEGAHKEAEITVGLLYGILISEPTKSQSYFKYLNLIHRDGLSKCILQTQRLINEKFHKMQDRIKERLIWLTGEFIKLDLSEAGMICICLLRHITAGDQKTIWLATQLIQLFINNKTFVYNHRKLLCTAVYSFLRLFPDHAKYGQLRNLEIKFCVDAIKEKFEDLATIGRDFIRVLYELRNFPEFGSIWQTLMKEPSKIGGQHFNGVDQILAMPTRGRYLQSRLTPEMERQLVFMMTEVKMGMQRRYQQWFAQKYLTSQESESLIVDIIRWICAAFHPPNYIIAGNYVQRWVMLGWLIKSIQNQQIAYQARIAIIFDWFFFNPKVDSVMNLEPAMLLMIHSIPKYVDITSSLLEQIFVFTKADNSPTHTFILSKEIITKNVQNAVATLTEKGVVQNLITLSESKHLNPNIKATLKKLFPAQTTLPTSKPKFLHLAPKISIPQNVQRPTIASPQSPGFGNLPFKLEEKKESVSPLPFVPPPSPVEKSPASPNEKVSQNAQPVSVDASKRKELSIFDPHLTEFSKNAMSNKEVALKALTNTIDIFNKETFEDDRIIIQLSEQIIRVLSFEFNVQDPKQIITNALLEHTLLYHLLDAFNNGLNTNVQQPSPQPPQNPNIPKRRTKSTKKTKDKYTTFMRYACSIEPSLGYRVLCYCVLKHKLVSEVEDIILSQIDVHNNMPLLNSIVSGNKPSDTPNKFAFYEWLLMIRRKPKMLQKDVFLQDLKCCADDNFGLVIILLPILVKNFPQFTKGSHEFLQVLLSNALPGHVQQIMNLITVNRLELLNDDAFPIMEASLSWDYFEMDSLWDIILCELRMKYTEEFEVSEFLIKLLNLDKMKDNLEVLKKFYDFVIHYEPTFDVVRCLLTLSPYEFGMFPSSLLYRWMRSNIDHSHDIVKAIKKLVKELYTNIKYKAEWKGKAQNVILNLLYVKKNETINQDVIDLDDRLFESLEFIQSINRLKEIHLTMSNVFDKLVDIESRAKRQRQLNNDDLYEDPDALSLDDEEDDIIVTRRTKRRKVSNKSSKI